MHPLVRFLARRVGFLILTYFIFLIAIFLLPRLIPGNPLQTKLYNIGATDPQYRTAVEAQLMRDFGWDKPLYVQFFDFVTRLFQGDLGKCSSESYYMRPVTSLFLTFLPWSLGLVVPALLLSWTIGNVLGVFAAYKRKTRIDNVMLPTFMTLSATPFYWLAMVLAYFLAFRLKIFPIFGAYNPLMTPALTLPFIKDLLWHWTLPFLSILLSSIGGWAIGMRSMAISELRSDFAGYADSLGLPDRKILKYVFRNSMLPQVTGLAITLGTMLGGSLVTEIVFGYPGTGSLLINGINAKDYPLIQGAFVLLVSTLLLATFIVDLVYAVIDPRIKTGYVGE